MTNEEAHRFLEDLQRKYTRDRHLYKPEFIEANGLAILALEKQIPKKPDFTDDYYDVAVCPCCHQYEFECGTTTWQMAFCPNCGQAIDWSDT